MPTQEYKIVREFLFVRGQVWILKDSQEYAVATLEGGGLGLLVFTDEDLATTYAEDSKLIGKMATPIMGNQNVVKFLLSVKGLGVTHLVVDHSIGKQAIPVSIDKAINHAQQAAANGNH
jgi:hypothetical protein